MANTIFHGKKWDHKRRVRRHLIVLPNRADKNLRVYSEIIGGIR